MKKMSLLPILLFLALFFTPAQAERVILQTGWENGQDHGYANQSVYPPKAVDNWSCQREVLPFAHGGLYSLGVRGTSHDSYSYLYCKAFDLNIPVENGMKIRYWIYHPYVPTYGSVKIAVDGEFTTGETIRDFVDPQGQRLQDQRRVPIHPALRGWYDNEDYTHTWYEVVVDLSAAAGRTLKYIMFAFDNGNDGFQGSYAAFIDDLKIFVDTGGGQPGCPNDSVPSNRWRGEYFSNKDLGGAPVMVRDDGEGFLDFAWELGSPNASCVPVDRFSVRWTRVIPFNGGRYEFTPSVDDGFRLYIDGHLVREAWVDQGETAYPVTVDLASGNHTVVFEYYENGGFATARLRWQQVQDSIPSNHWKGEYFNNKDLSGAPVMVRDDGEGFLDFPWELGSPNSSYVHQDRFSVRWTRIIPFNGGRYEFIASVDDGFRLYINGHLVREAWVDQGETAYPVTVDLTSGNHTVVFEYYENGGFATARLSWREVGSPQPQVAFYNDPLNIPTTPSDDAWFLSENKSVEQNREEIALVVDPTNGEKAQFVREHLARGGRVVLLVCGLGNWGTGPTGWERPIATYANDYLDAVVLRVNYGIGLIGFAYPLSFNKGVDHVTQMALKARKAGSNLIRLYGHSEGSDVSAKVVAIMASPTNRQVHPRGLTGTWNGQGNPSWFEGGFGFGNPADVGICTPTIPPLPPSCIGLTSAAAPPPDALKLRGGFFRYTGEYKGNYYGNKYVLFNRKTDPANTGLGYTFFLIAGTIGTSAHDYRGVFSVPEFMAEYEAVLNPTLRPANASGFLWGNGAYVDRDAGERFDFVNAHWIPYIPGTQEMSQATLTVTNYPPNGPPTSREVSHGRMKFYEASGIPIDETGFDLEEYASREIANPLGYRSAGAAILFTDEQVGVVTRYHFEGSDRYFGAAYPSESYPSRTLYVPFLAKGWNYGRNGWRQTTELILFNPNPWEAQVTVTYSNGTPGIPADDHRLTRTIPARGMLRLTSMDLPSEWSSNEGILASAVVRSNVPLTGMVRNQIGYIGSSTGTIYNQYSESNYRIFTTRGSKKIFAPFLKVSSQDYESLLYVQNTSDRAVNFAIRLYGNGGRWDTIPSQSLPPYGLKAISLSPYVPSYFVGSAVLEVTSPSTGTLALAVQLASAHGAQAHEGIPDGTYTYQKKNDLVQIPLILDQRNQSDAQWDAEINVVNMGSAAEALTIKYRGADGGEVHSVSKPIDPEKYVNLASPGDLPDYVPPQLFNGSAVVEGTRNQKRLGAAAEIKRLDMQYGTEFHDITMGYSAWW